MRTTCFVALFVLSAIASAEDTCEKQLAVGLSRLNEVPAEERSALVLSAVADLCPTKVPATLSPSLKSLVSATAASRPQILGQGAAEAPDEFEAACPGWSKRADGKAANAVFTQCRFDRFKVVTAAEFAKADVHFATTALVLYDVLVKAGVRTALAKKAARLVILPLEAK